MNDKMLPVGTNYCKCPSCGEYFSNEGTFDIHRSGVGRDRSCTAPGSLFNKKGGHRLVLNKRGYWVRPGSFSPSAV